MNDELFRELLESVKEAGEIKRGQRAPARRTFVDTTVDVLRVRQKLNLSRQQFATLLGVSERTVEGWEQGRRQPAGPARMLLRVAARHPHAVLDTAKSSWRPGQASSSPST